MLGIILAYWKYILLFVIFLFVAHAIQKTYFEPKDVPEKETAKTILIQKLNEDSLKAIHSLALQYQKDSILKVDSLRLKIQKHLTEKFRDAIQRETARADSAEERYNRQKTIERCDSTIKHKNIVIRSKDSLINSLDQEAQEYSSLAYTYQCKYAIAQEEVDSKKDLISYYKNLNTDYNCFLDWKSKHKFWVWLLRAKCKN